MNLLVFLPYAAVCAVYCIDVWKRARLSHVLKPLLVPALVAGYLLCGAPVGRLMLLGAVLGWVGDVALMAPRGKGFIAGLAAFLLGHVAYTVWTFAHVQGAGAWWTLAYLPVVALAVWAVYSRLKGGVGALRPAVLAYMAAISLMSVAAFALMTAQPCAGSLVMWLGSVFFIASDCMLAHGLFARRLPHHDFLVMSTYMLAQLGMMLGAAMTGLA